tara:strand:- start:560 stop:973 length:414 start_codon:yes stop_codon:yes gene_type:complete
MKISTLLIVLLIVSGVVVGTYSMINDLATDYGVTVDQNYLDSFNKTLQLNEELNSKYLKVQNLSAKTGSSFNIITLVPDVLSIVKDVIKLPFTVTGELLNSFNEFLGLPKWVYNTLLGIFVVLMIFAFISLVLRYNS